MRRSKHLPLLVLLFAYVLIALGYSLTVPLGEAPDEVSHFAYVQSIAQDHRLPTPDSPGWGEAHQAPGYYVVGAALTAWIPGGFQFIANPDWQLGDPDTPNLLLHTRQEAFPYRGAALAWHLLRLLSVVLGLFTVALTYLLALEIFPGQKAIALIAASFIAFLPQFDFLSGMVNSDNLIIPLTLACWYYFLRAWDSGSLRTGVILGALLGLAFLVKLTALAQWATIAFAVVIGLKGGGFGERIKNLIVMIAVAGFFASPWVIYNAINFGDPLTTSRLAPWARAEPITLPDMELYAGRMYESFWLKFGGASHLGFPPFAYLSLGGLLLLAAFGIALRANDLRRGGIAALNRNALIVLLVFPSLLLLAHLRQYLSTNGFDQARQVFAALPSLSILLAAGIARLSRNSTRLPVAFGGGMGLLAVAGFVFVTSLYAPPMEMRDVPLPTATAVDFGNKIRITGYRVTPTSASRGDSSEVEIHWQALDDLHEDYWVLFQLVDKAGNVEVNQDGVPSAGRVTTDWWLKGQKFSAPHTLRLPGDLDPGTYELRVGIHPFGRWEWLAVRGQDSFTLTEIEVK